MRAAPSPVGLVLLAAGEGRRFGSPKQLAMIGGRPMLQITLESASAIVSTVIVVTGAHRESVEPLATSFPGVTVVHNAAWNEGMGGSIAQGIARLATLLPDAGAAIIALADQPAVGSEDFAALVAVHRQHRDAIAVATWDDTQGPPCLFPRSCFAALKSLGGADGARSVWRSHPERVIFVPVPGAAIDIDTQQEWTRFVARNGSISDSE